MAALQGPAWTGKEVGGDGNESKGLRGLWMGGGGMVNDLIVL